MNRPIRTHRNLRPFAARLADCDRLVIDDADLLAELNEMAVTLFNKPTGLIVRFGDPLADGPELSSAVNADGTGTAVQAPALDFADTFARRDANSVWRRLEKRLTEIFADKVDRGTVGTYLIPLSRPVRVEDVEPGDYLEAAYRTWRDSIEQPVRWMRVRVDRKPWAGGTGAVVVSDGSGVVSVVESSLRRFMI